MSKTTQLSDSAQRNNDNNVIGGDSNRNLSKSKKLKNDKSGIQTYIKATGKPMFLTLGIRGVFNQLKQMFIKAPILQHFDLECSIRIETNASGYAKEEVFSQLTSDHLTSNQGQ